MISLDVGYDAGKQIHGRKRHLSVDLLGLVLRVLVTSASVPEREGANKSSNEFIAWKIRSSDYIQCGWTGDIGGKTLCDGLWICLGGLWKLSSDLEREKGFHCITKTVGG
jgi:hypothetical protein